MMSLIFLVLGSILGYFVYNFIIAPYMERKRLLKHTNVLMTEKFYPLLGDTAVVLQNKRENKYYFYDIIEAAAGPNNYDVKLGSRGTDIRYYAISCQAMKEFVELVPSHIDRDDIMNRFFGKMSPDAFGAIKTTDNWKMRRNAANTTIGLNYASKYVPKMVECMDKQIDKWSVDQWINFNQEISSMAFGIICTILFGMDIEDRIRLCDYNELDGKITKMDFPKFFSTLIEDIMQTVQKPLGLVFPFLIDYNLIKPYSVVQKNCVELHSVLLDFLKQSSDSNSVFRQLLDEHNIPEYEAFQDIISLLFAGHDTTSHAITSVVYFMKKFPDVYENLKEELAKAGIAKDSDYRTDEVKDTIQSCDYLMYVIKETLRMDPPSYVSLPYKISQPIEICGVTIPKGRVIQASTIALGYDSREWQEPLSFIPERFNPESPYFQKPGGGQRSPYAMNTFSNGPRKCPGQILAMLELRIIIAKIVTSIDYEIDEDQLKNDYARFAMFSNFKLKLKFKGRF